MKLKYSLTLSTLLSFLVASGARAEGPCPAGFDSSLLPLPEGVIVATCFAGFNTPYNPASGVNLSGFVVAIVDVRTPFLPDTAPGPTGLGLNWCAPSYHNELAVAAHQWRAATLGQIFGVTLDTATPPNIYVAASTVYAPASVGFGPAGPGAIYRLNGSGGTIGNPINLPNTGPGLGNICHNPKHDQFFVSNFEDGRIYRLSSGCASALSTFDHATGSIAAGGAPEPGDTPGFVTLRERVWGVRVFRDRLYYSLWVEDAGTGRQNPTRANEIWSIALDGAGNFTGAAQLEISLPPTYVGGNVSSPVSDIRFSPSGTMFLAERTRTQDTGTGNGGDAHGARVLEYQLSGLTWVPSGRNFSVGNYSVHHNSAGGLDVDCQGDVWQTGDALIFSSSGRPPTGLPADNSALIVYGFQKTPASGNSGDNVTYPPNYVGRSSIYIDLDREPQATDKTQIGSLEIFKKNCVECCVNISNKLVECVETNMTYKWDVCITNCWDKDIKYFSFVDLPTNIVMSEDIITLQSVLRPGQGTCFTLYITNTPGLTNLCFTVGAHTTNFDVCCSVTNCLALAPCCVWIFHDFATPITGQPNCYTYQPAVIKNVSTTPMKYLFFVPQPDAPNNCFNFTPNIITFNPPVQPGATATALQRFPQTLKLTFTPGCPMPFCFLASLHDSNLVNCCSSREYITHVSQPVAFPAGFHGSVFAAGANIAVPVITDKSAVGLKRLTLYEGSNAVRTIECPPLCPEDGQHDDYYALSNAMAGTYVFRWELLDVLDGVWSTDPATVFVVDRIPPSVGTPVLFLPAAALGGGQVRFLLRTLPGVTCYVEYTERLIPANWQVFQTIVGDGSTVTVIDSVANAPQRFFRVRMP